MADSDDVPGARDGGPTALRVAQLTVPGRFGGLETVVRQLSSGLVGRGHDVRVLCRLDEDVDPETHPFVTALRGEGVEVHVIQLPHRAYAKEIILFERLLREFDAHVVHTHGYHADVVGAWAARRAEVPRVATAHGFTRGGWKNRLYETLQKRSYRSAAAVLAVSRPIAEELSADPAVAPLVRRLPTAWVPRTDHAERVAAREALGLDPEDFVVGWVGRMSREKGPDVMVDAMRHAEAAGMTLCMVGDGPLREALSSGDEAGPGARVLWAGAVPDAGRLFPAFDVVVLSSRTEGTPMVLLEAMDAGVPIVATRVGGVPDVVGPEEALLVEPEAPAALREAVRSVRRDEAAARGRARRAAERLAEAFDPDAWLDEHEALYRAAAAGFAPEGGP